MIVGVSFFQIGENKTFSGEDILHLKVNKLMILKFDL
jgi:hypothetical protein